MYDILLTKQAVKDADNLEKSGLKSKVVGLLRIVKQNPYQNPPPYEKLQGYNAVYSRRINRQHRFVYEIMPNTDNLCDENKIPFTGIVKVIRMWTHYE
jgi:Txe/YoeB family toxin of toxin-antitoxin system